MNLAVGLGTSAVARAQSIRGLDLASIDRSVPPGQDFFTHANGAWLKTAEIPPDKSSWGAGSQLAEETTVRTRGLLDEASKGSAPAGSEGRKIGDYYATYLDEAAIEAKGIAALKPKLDRIAAVKDLESLSRMLGEELRADVDPLNATHFHTTRLFGLWVSPDFNAPTRNVPYLLQGGIGLPDREYYVGPAPKMAEIRTKYQAHIAAMLTLAGIPDGAAKAARIVALESKIAATHASRSDSELVVKANNPWPRAEFATRAPGLSWDSYFRAAKLDKAPMIMVWHAGAVKGISALVASEPVEAWRDWMTFHAIARRGNVLPKAFVNEQFAFYGKTLFGTPQLSERWKRAVQATSVAMGDGVGKLYVNKYFPPEAKAQVQAMVTNIRAAFSARLDKLTWMSPATRKKAREKLGTLYVGCGYPEKWTDYATLEIVRGDAVGNAERAEQFEYNRSLSKLDKPVDQGEWAMTPQTVNAVNLPLQNALNFPAAILQPPYFDPTASAAANYGAIGATIGHEISHSFDDQGAQFDAHGKLSDWWTKEDRAHFEEAGKKLVAQYDAYQPLPDLHINGQLTLSENIADLAGLSATHDAWLKLAAKDPKSKAELAPGIRGEQLFFLAYSQSWRRKAREALERQMIIVDGHSPAHYRVYTVRNLDAWYTAFNIKPGDAMYLAPKDRVRVW